MDIVVANGFAMERCAFFSREYHCCVLHNTRCKCEDYNPRNSKPFITNADCIRAMADEALAKIMALGCPPNYPHECSVYENNDGTQDCSMCWLNWLKKEANDDK